MSSAAVAALAGVTSTATIVARRSRVNSLDGITKGFRSIASPPSAPPAAGSLQRATANSGPRRIRSRSLNSSPCGATYATAARVTARADDWGAGGGGGGARGSQFFAGEAAGAAAALILLTTASIQDLTGGEGGGWGNDKVGGGGGWGIDKVGGGRVSTAWCRGAPPVPVMAASTASLPPPPHMSSNSRRKSDVGPMKTAVTTATTTVDNGLDRPGKNNTDRFTPLFNSSDPVAAATASAAAVAAREKRVQVAGPKERMALDSMRDNVKMGRGAAPASITTIPNPLRSLPTRRGDSITDVYMFGSDDEVVGRGSRGAVSAATHRQTGKRVAVKRMLRAETSRLEVMEEVEMLTLAGKHPNIVTMQEFYEDQEAYYIVMELCKGGELFNRLVDKGRFSEGQSARIVAEVTEAVFFLHRHGIVHFDLKPENIMLAMDGDCVPEVRVADFGSAFKKDAELHRARDYTVAYCAPEVLLNGSVDEKVDMWALGVVMWVLLSGRHPFGPDFGLSEAEVARRIAEEEPDLRSPAIRHVSPEGKDLVRRLLAKDPDDRPSAREVLAHPWLRSVITRAGTNTPGETLRRKKQMGLGWTAHSPYAFSRGSKNGNRSRSSSSSDGEGRKQQKAQQQALPGSVAGSVVGVTAAASVGGNVGSLPA